MAKFKPEQKVVYNGRKHGMNPEFKYPEIGEVITVVSPSDYLANHYYIYEYPKGIHGQIQSFYEKALEPLIEDETTDHSVTFISSPDSRKLAEKARDYNPMEVPEHIKEFTP